MNDNLKDTRVWKVAGDRPKAFDDITELTWSNLEDFECPKCGDRLIDDGPVIRCVERDECGFRIGREKYEKILADMDASDLAESFMDMPDFKDD